MTGEPLQRAPVESGTTLLERRLVMATGDDVRGRFGELATALPAAARIVTAAAGSARGGCLVGFATQASIDPGRLLVCISIENATFEIARNATHLGVHVVPADRRDLAELFGGETGDEMDKFAGRPMERGSGGEPLLTECGGRLSGRVLGRHEYGDHVGFLLEPVAVWVDGSSSPLDIRDAAGIEPGHSP
ncbi:MAG: flavin reductase family protein [Actinoallomurus sp.]